MEDKKKVPEIRFSGFTDDWEERSLGEICTRVTRKNKNGESDLPLTIASQYGLIDQRDFFSKVVAAKDMSNYYLLEKGEFAYNKSYSNGYDYGSIKRLNAYAKGCLSTLYICFGLSSDEVESDYLECYFDTLKWYENIAQICAEGARNHGLLNVDTKLFFEQVYVYLPTSKEEQRKIASCVNAIDELIALQQQKLDAMKKYKKGLLQKMFPKDGEKVPEIRFPGFTDDWEQRKLGDVTSKIGSGKTPLGGKESYVDEGICLIRSQNVYDDMVDLSDVVYIDEDTDEAMENSRVKVNDVLLNITGASIGRSAVYSVHRRANVNQHVCIVRPIEGYDPKYIQLNISSSNGQEQIESSQAGGGREGLNFQQIGKMQFMFPSITEQKKIGEYFSSLDTLITLHQRKLDAMREYKKGLLQKMFV